jgi:hypothetical protein
MAYAVMKQLPNLLKGFYSHLPRKQKLKHTIAKNLVFHPELQLKKHMFKASFVPYKTILLVGLSVLVSFQAHAEAVSQSHTAEILEKTIHGVKIIEPCANLLEYPLKRKESEIYKQYTLGDLHGNALKLIYFLIRENLIEMTKEDYERISSIYYKDVQAIEMEDLQDFQSIINRLAFRKLNADSMIRLLGDEFCDRGENDYYTLKILEKMHLQSVPFEILFSNHGYELISVFEKGLMTNISYLETVDCGGSLTHLRNLIQRGLVSYQEVERLIRDVYFQHLKLIALTHMEDGTHMTLYSHAPISLKTLDMLAVHRIFAMSYTTIQAIGFDNVVDRINKIFQEILIKGQITKEFEHEVHNQFQKDKIPLSMPVGRCIWSRGFHSNDQPIKQLNQVAFSYVHGHDGNGHTEEDFRGFVINLDNLFGKGRGNEKRVYSVYLSQEGIKCNN